MTRISTRSRLLWILLALVTASAVLIAVGGTEASANPDGKTYEAYLARPGPYVVTAGVDEEFTLTVINTSDSTPLGAVNLEIPIEFDTGTDPVVVEAPDGPTSWNAEFNINDNTVELRARSSSERLDPSDELVVTFGAIGLQEFLGSEVSRLYDFTIEARQANSFSGDPGNGIAYVQPLDGQGELMYPYELTVEVFGVAKHCTDTDCELSQGLGDEAVGTFTLSGTCDAVNCGVIAIDLVSPGDDLSIGKVRYAPAEGSTDVRAHLTLPKDTLTKAASRYTFDLYNEDDTLKQADLSKCQRGDTNCIEKIERTKTDVTWIFKVDPVDPRMDWK